MTIRRYCLEINTEQAKNDIEYAKQLLSRYDNVLYHMGYRETSSSDSKINYKPISTIEIDSNMMDTLSSTIYKGSDRMIRLVYS